MVKGFFSLLLQLYLVQAIPDRDLIIGGSPAPRYDFFAVPQGRNGILCGSTLVHPDILITAAHCAIFFDGEVFNIGASLIDGSDAVDTIAVDTIRIHPEFDVEALEDEMNGNAEIGSASLLHDIAIIKLRSASRATPAAWNKDPDLIQPGDFVKVVGFGNDENGSIPYYLLEVSLEVVDEDTCSLIYQGYSEIDGDSQICAGKTDAGACTGDSGGPLLYNDVLIGVVSFGLVLDDGGCESGDFPDVYTRISGHKEFIEQGICELSAVPPTSCGDGEHTAAPTINFPEISTSFSPTQIPTAGISPQSPTTMPTDAATGVVDISKWSLPPLVTQAPSELSTKSPTETPNTVDRSDFSVPPIETSFPSPANERQTPYPTSIPSSGPSTEGSNNTQSLDGSQTVDGTSSGFFAWERWYLVPMLLSTICAK